MSHSLDATAISCQAHNEPEAHFRVDRVSHTGSKFYAFDDTNIPSELGTGAAYGSWRTDENTPSAGGGREHPVFRYTKHVDPASGNVKYHVQLSGTAVPASGNFTQSQIICTLPENLKPIRAFKVLVAADSGVDADVNGAVVYVSNSSGNVIFEKLLTEDECNRVYVDGISFWTDNTKDTATTF